MKTTISFTLDTERDRDILQWLNNLPDGGRSQAIRGGAAGESRSAGGDVGGCISGSFGVEARWFCWQPGSTGLDQAGDDEPPDIASNLDNLGL